MLKRMENQLGSEAGVRPSKLEREWQGQVDALREKLQKHRDAAVARCVRCFASELLRLKSTCAECYTPPSTLLMDTY